MTPKAYDAGALSSGHDRFVHELTGTVAVEPGDTLNVRKAADVHSDVLTTLDNGAAITLLGEEMNGGTKWILISAGNKSGWVNVNFIRL